MAIDERALSEPWRVDARDMDLRWRRPVVTPPKVWEVIFHDLQGQILNGAWAYDHPIPSERQLALDYQVARPTIREALLALQVEGLIEMQRGRTGGALLRWPSKRSEEEIRAELRRTFPQLLEIIDYRMGEEAFAARRAASRHSEEHLKVLHESVRDMKHASKVLGESEEELRAANSSPKAKQDIGETMEKARLEYRRADARFHLAVAVAAMNPHLLDSVRRLRTEFWITASVDLLVRTASRRGKAIDDHEEILDAIKARNKDEAARAMLEHIKATEHALAELLLENQLEKQIVVKQASRDAAADKVREALRETKVFALGHDAYVNTEDVAEGGDILRYVIDDGSEITVPVFTRYEFTEAAYERNPAWRTLPVAEVRGDVLLDELGQELTVVINPWSPLKFKLRVA